MSEKLADIAGKMVAPGKGILAADESSATIGKRFDSIGVANTENNRRDYRELLFTAREAMSRHISGVILYDETLRQKARNGALLINAIVAAGCVPGIKVDQGAKTLALAPGEKITEGLDGLRERLEEYRRLGARFAKWRAVIDIADGLPTWGCIKANAHALARYAGLCQEQDIVPIVEPEVLMDGPASGHGIERCYEVSALVLRTVFNELYDARVELESMVLKPSMVIAGKSASPATPEEVAERTVRCLKETVPAAVPGIAFLSGGQSEEQATHHLSLMNADAGPALAADLFLRPRPSGRCAESMGREA